MEFKDSLANVMNIDQQIQNACQSIQSVTGANKMNLSQCEKEGRVRLLEVINNRTNEVKQSSIILLILISYLTLTHSHNNIFKFRYR